MAGRNRCGFQLTSGEHKGKKCNLGAGHDVVSESNPTATRHKYTPPKARPALTIASIRDTVVKVTDPTVMAKHRRTKDTGDKSAERQFIDQVVQAAYDAWVESGKPKDWVKSFGLLLTVPKDQVTTFRDRIHTSAKAMGYKASFGDSQDTDNGQVIVALRVTDIPADNSANGNAATTNVETSNTDNVSETSSSQE